MKSRLKILYKLIFAMVLVAPLTAAGAREGDSGRIESLDEMTFLEMLNSVETGKQSELIQKFQNKEGRTRLLNGKFGPKSPCTVEAYRNKEVLLVTIPASLLFAPNSTTLRETADGWLAPFKRYLKQPDTYRVMLVMHTDNTGSESYRDQLTTDRVDAVFDWFERSGADTTYLFSYSLSDDMPLYANDSMEHRDQNRRLEIYLVPGKKMVEQAKKGSIAF